MNFLIHSLILDFIDQSRMRLNDLPEWFRESMLEFVSTPLFNYKFMTSYIIPMKYKIYTKFEQNVPCEYLTWEG